MLSGDWATYGPGGASATEWADAALSFADIYGNELRSVDGDSIVIGLVEGCGVRCGGYGVGERKRAGGGDLLRVGERGFAALVGGSECDG